MRRSISGWRTAALMERARRFLARISIRLLAFNLLLVFLPFFVFFSLQTYERQLLEMQERSMVQQGRLFAAALGSREAIDATEVERILVDMRQAFDARLRVIDPGYNLVADSSQLGPRKGEAQAAPADSEVRLNPLYRFGSFLYRGISRWFLPPERSPLEEDDLGHAGRLAAREVQQALSGSYGRATRVSPRGERSLTLSSALPIWNGDEVIGAVLVTKSTFQILRSVHALRLSAFKVVLASVTAAVILSLLVSTTINRPLVRLREEAQAILDRRGRLRGGFSVSKRLDEIGDLNRALAELTRRLEGHLQFIESFTSDVSHEFRNPLAAIRNATELLAEVDDPDERQRFFGMIQNDIARLEHLLSGVREISRIDARANERPFEILELGDTLRKLIERFEMARQNSVEFRLVIEGPVEVAARPERIIQVFENLITNAISFSPIGEEILIEVERQADRVLTRITDAGSGIPPEHLERIFERFFSYRPEEKRAKSPHTGLGLAIVKAIVENHGGRVVARQRLDREGAVFEVELPLAEASPT